MPRQFYKVNAPDNINDLVQQLNKILQQLTIQLQRIEGLDDYTTEFFGDIEHTGDNLGFFSATPVAQQSAITNLSSTPTDAEIQTAVNSIISTLENLGFVQNG